MATPVLPHASAIPYFYLDSLKDTECLTERNMIQLVKRLKETYEDNTDLEFVATTDLLAEYMILPYPFIFKIQRFIRHCDRFNICIAHLLDNTPKQLRYAIEGCPLDPSDYETLQ